MASPFSTTQIAKILDRITETGQSWTVDDVTFTEADIDKLLRWYKLAAAEEQVTAGKMFTPVSFGNPSV